MAILSDAEIINIKSDIREIISDDVIATSIIYKQSGSTVSTWDPTIGSIPDMYTSSSVSSFKGSYTVEEINNSGGELEYGDVKFIIMVSDVSGVLSVDDMVVEGGTSLQSATTHQIKYITRDPLDICYFIGVRRLFGEIQ